MDPLDARKRLTSLMREHGDFGAVDTEGWQAVGEVMDAAEQGKPFPFKRSTEGNPLQQNPFQLYETVDGWQLASDQLVDAAEAYWRALVEQRLGIRTEVQG